MLKSPVLYWVDKLYHFLIRIGSNLQSIFLLYMRLTWGHQLFRIGLSKLQNIPATTDFFTKLGIPFPSFHAYEIGFLEMIAGLFLFLGFASRLAALPVICIMLTALSTAHAVDLADLKFVTNPMTLVIQQPYPFLITAVLVFIFGPGRISVDGWLKRWAENQPRY